MTNKWTLSYWTLCLCMHAAMSYPKYDTDLSYARIESMFTKDGTYTPYAEHGDTGYGNTVNSYEKGNSGYGDGNTGYLPTEPGYGENLDKDGTYTPYVEHGDTGYGDTVNGYEKGKSGYGDGNIGYLPTEPGYGESQVYADTDDEFPANKDGYIPTKPGYGDGHSYNDTKVVYPDYKPTYTPNKPKYGDSHGYDGIPNGYKDGHSYGKPVPVAKCQAEMVFTFNDPKNPFQEIKRRIWAQGVGKVFVSGGAANFFGYGHIEIPYFNKNYLRPGYFLSIVIRPEGYHGEPQSIFSNSFSTKYATLTLSLEGDHVVLTIVERPAGKYGYDGKYRSKPIQLSVKINKEGYTRITIKQDDKTVVLSSDYDVKKAYSRLPAITHEPLYIGAGASAVKKLSPFKGSVDEFIFSKCPVNKKH